MFRKLKIRLILLYGITSSIILTLILFGVFLINYRQNREQMKILFQKDVEQIVEMIRSNNMVDQNWIVKMQQDNHLVVFIEENGKELTNYNRLSITPDIQAMKEHVKGRAETEGIYLNQRPLYSSIQKTSVYTLRQNVWEIYLGMATIIPKNSGWLNIMAVYHDKMGMNALLKQALLFIVIDISGVAALFLISSLYIKRVLKPLEEGQIKQKAFIAAASHELRSPLTVIKAGISSLKGEISSFREEISSFTEEISSLTDDITKSSQFLQLIEGECTRMTSLISDMLLLASADANTWSLQKEFVDMDTLLIESYDIFCSCYPIHNHAITLDLPEEKLHEISGDKERIKQVLTILVDNAMNHTPLGSALVLRAYNLKHFVVVEVEDHGNGIGEEEKKQVFERFYQGNKSRNDKKHFGLGLSIAKELMELQEGDIYIKDTVGGGATFVLKLPY